MKWSSFFKTETNFLRNSEFIQAVAKIDGPLRQIFVEFLRRSCTAQFTGFLLYKEHGRGLKGFGQRVVRFQSGLDLGFLTKAQKYTFFKPKFIFYATYLSERISYGGTLQFTAILWITRVSLLPDL